MNGVGVAFVLVGAATLLLLPRRWASIPLVAGSSYMTLEQSLEVGPFHFTVTRVLIAVGLARLLIRWEPLAGGLNRLDRCVLLWAATALAATPLHRDPAAALVFALGFVYNVCGVYFLVRAFCCAIDDITVLCRIIVIVLTPVAAEMVFEQLTGHNVFAALGGVDAITAMRDGALRAQGPFAHPILAGTVGAVCLPLAVALWRSHRTTAIIGLATCSTMILASRSSGPLLSVLAAVAALAAWSRRFEMRRVRWSIVIGYAVLNLVMNAPAYYLIARIDIVGGSTGWHRARLIESALEHLDEWWLAGTDYTRHWMVTGVSWSPDHTDITNHYVHMGVVGGLPLTALLIAILAAGFSFVGRLQQEPALPIASRFMLWCLGASLFAHTVTGLSVSYFDQSFAFLYLTLAAVGSAERSAAIAHAPRRQLAFAIPPRMPTSVASPVRDPATS